MRKLRTRKAEALADLAREQKIDIKKFSGLEQIIDALKEKLFQSEAQRALDREFQLFETLERISRLEATREDIRFSAPFLKEFKIDLKSAMKFYDLAFKRDQVLSDAVIASAAKQSRIIFITGGFHTDGIKQKLKQSGISYQVITPKISTVGSNENYLKVMRGEVSYAHPRNLETEIAAVGDDDAKIIMRRKLQEWRMRFSGVPIVALPILDRQLGIAALAPNIQTAAHPLHQQFLDAAAAVNERLVEATSIRAIFGFVAQMPLAEDAGRVAYRLEHLRQRRRRERHAFSLENRMRDSALELVPAGHQRRARRGASRADMKVGEAHALGVEPIKIRCLQNRVPMSGNVAIALIVGNQKHDVRLAPGERIGGRRRRRAESSKPSGEEEQRGESISTHGRFLNGFSACDGISNEA